MQLEFNSEEILSTPDKRESAAEDDFTEELLIEASSHLSPILNIEDSEPAVIDLNHEMSDRLKKLKE